MTFENPVTIMRGGFARLREVVRLLSKHGIRAEIVEPPGAKTNA